MSDSFGSGEDLQDAVHGRRLREWVRRVDDGLAGEPALAGVHRLDRGGALHGEDDELAEPRRFGERADRRLRARAGFPRRELRRVSRSAHHLVTVLQEPVREHLTDDPGPDHSDLHWAPLARPAVGPRPLRSVGGRLAGVSLQADLPRGLADRARHQRSEACRPAGTRAGSAGTRAAR